MSLLIPVTDVQQVRTNPLRWPVVRVRDWLRKKAQLRLMAEQIRKERSTLSTLSDAELRDIGITRADVAEEIRRGYWDLPAERVERLEK